MTTNGPTSGPMPPTAQPAQPAAFGSPSQRKDGRADGFALSSRATATRSRLAGTVFRRTVLQLALFAGSFALLLGVFLLFFTQIVGNVLYALSGYDWSAYSVLLALFWPLVIACFVAGVLLIVRAGIHRAFGYYGLLLDSVEQVLSKQEGPVVLPPELAETSAALNAIKLENERSERAAHAAEQRKNELVVYLAHDIKTPLTSIVGYLTLLDESPDLPVETRARYAHITLEKAYRLEELLDEFFEITRYNLSSIPLERSRFDAALFCRQVIEEFYPVAEARGLELAFEGPDELAVLADAKRMSRVVNNVLKNAVAYADPDTRVVLHTSVVPSADGTPWWEVTVTDTGREVSPHHLEHIFERFYRADDARTAEEGGAGLGLAIAREIARAHGGDIYAASAQGVTSFTVWIPRALPRRRRADQPCGRARRRPLPGRLVSPPRRAGRPRRRRCRAP